MTTFQEHLRQRSEAIARRWLAAALAVYPADASAAFTRQRDPFANPVGHSLREGTRAILEALASGGEVDQTARRHLDQIVRIRAVQEMPPSQAVRFVLELKSAVRAELNSLGDAERFAGDLARLGEAIDRIVLAAFDLYVACREQVCELKVREARRRVSWIVDKINAHWPDTMPSPEQPVAAAAQGCPAQREGVR